MKNHSATHHYIFPEKEQPVENEVYTMKTIMSFFLLYNSIIPLDLVVVFTIMKAWYTVFLIDDHHMIDFEHSVHEKALVGCEVKNLTTIEDLSKVNNIFCDKTGTLTKNQLIFRGMGIKERTFEINKDEGKDNLLDFRNEVIKYLGAAEDKEEFLNLWRCICICHECI